MLGRATRGDRQAAPTTPRDRTGRKPAEAAALDDEGFHLLQTRRRRLALRYLRDHEGPVEMRALAEQVAAWEPDTTTAALTSKARQRVYIPPYQTHLPKLDDAGVIEYDQSRGVVEPTDRIHPHYPYLAAEGGMTDEAAAEVGAENDVEPGVEEAAGRWADDATVVYGGASLFGAGLVAAVWGASSPPPGSWSRPPSPPSSPSSP